VNGKRMVYWVMALAVLSQSSPAWARAPGKARQPGNWYRLTKDRCVASPSPDAQKRVWDAQGKAYEVYEGRGTDRAHDTVYLTNKADRTEQYILYRSKAACEAGLRIDREYEADKELEELERLSR
jgi:hypothetical protein